MYPCKRKWKLKCEIAFKMVQRSRWIEELQWIMLEAAVSVFEISGRERLYLPRTAHGQNSALACAGHPGRQFSRASVT